MGHDLTIFDQPKSATGIDPLVIFHSANVTLAILPRPPFTGGASYG